MTTIERLRRDVPVAGVPWPVSKLAALAAGALTLLVVGVISGSAATAVLSAAGVATVVGLVLAALSRAPMRHSATRHPAGGSSITAS